MAIAFKHFCTIKSQIKGDHVYKADPWINSSESIFLSRVEGNIFFSKIFFFGKGNNRYNQCH